MNKPLNARGDTIVEVMIAIAILAAVLGGAYAAAGRSLRIARQSEERGTALKLAEGQLEKLKALAPDPANNMFSAATFCIDDGTPPVPPAQVTGFSGSAPDTDLAADDFSNYPGACQVTQNGVYNLSIQYDSSASAYDLFTILVRWDRLGGGRDEVRLLLRLHP